MSLRAPPTSSSFFDLYEQLGMWPKPEEDEVITRTSAMERPRDMTDPALAIHADEPALEEERAATKRNVSSTFSAASWEAAIDAFPVMDSTLDFGKPRLSEEFAMDQDDLVEAVDYVVQDDIPALGDLTVATIGSAPSYSHLDASLLDPTQPYATSQRNADTRPLDSTWASESDDETLEDLTKRLRAAIPDEAEAPVKRGRPVSKGVPDDRNPGGIWNGEGGAPADVLWERLSRVARVQDTTQVPPATLNRRPALPQRSVTLPMQASSSMSTVDQLPQPAGPPNNYIFPCPDMAGASTAAEVPSSGNDTTEILHILPQATLVRGSGTVPMPSKPFEADSRRVSPRQAVQTSKKASAATRISLEVDRVRREERNISPRSPIRPGRVPSDRRKFSPPPVDHAHISPRQSLIRHLSGRLQAAELDPLSGTQRPGFSRVDTTPVSAPLPIASGVKGSYAFNSRPQSPFTMSNDAKQGVWHAAPIPNVSQSVLSAAQIPLRPTPSHTASLGQSPLVRLPSPSGPAPPSPHEERPRTPTIRGRSRANTIVSNANRHGTSQDEEGLIHVDPPTKLSSTDHAMHVKGYISGLQGKKVTVEYWRDTTASEVIAKAYSSGMFGEHGKLEGWTLVEIFAELGCGASLRRGVQSARLTSQNAL